MALSIDALRVLSGDSPWHIEHGDAEDVLQNLPGALARLVFLDPAWSYAAGRKGHGRAEEHYKTLTLREIAAHIKAAYRVAQDPAYLVTWATWPTLHEWISKYGGQVEGSGWKYSSGGSWCKVKGQGIGYYWWGDSEPILLYTKGKAVPPATEGKPSNMLFDWQSLWMTERVRPHSAKPVHTLEAVVTCYTAPGELVLDFYAGNTGRLCEVCWRLGRRYLGVEIDADRAGQAIMHMQTIQTSPEQQARLIS